jgi:hypothetical protein
LPRQWLSLATACRPSAKKRGVGIRQLGFDGKRPQDSKGQLDKKAVLLLGGHLAWPVNLLHPLVKRAEPSPPWGRPGAAAVGHGVAVGRLATLEPC